MGVFQDRGERYHYLNPEHVSALEGTEHDTCIAHLRSGSRIAISATVLEVWAHLRTFSKSRS